MTTARSEGSLASLLLVHRLADSAAEPLKAGEYWPLVRAVPNLADLLGLAPAEMADRFGLTPELAEQVAARLDGATALAFRLEDLEQSGLQALTPFDPDYPQSLVDRLTLAPPVLYVAGDPTLLGSPLLGIVGSRTVDEDGAEVARSAARLAVHHGHGVASGGAKGVDQVSMRAALDAEGKVVGVLADSLLRALREPETRRAISGGQACFCTPFKPDAAFSVANAMGRNKLIYALSAATLVVAADDGSGGTWAGAKEALASGRPVISWIGPGAGPGNSVLADRGATRLTELDQLFPLPAPKEPAPPVPAKEQLTFGL
jgi:predicted Rossmann fold nucleotide-binding protein DprA/Smf involved in DNA uptake